MVVGQWTPHVECSKSRSVPEVMSSCLVALDRMPTSDHQEVFGARGQANIDVPLPVKYTDRLYMPYSPFCVIPYLLICLAGYGRCSIEVSLTGPPVRANWYGIWACAVTIVAMCVRSKREGVSVGRFPFPSSLVRVMGMSRTDILTAAGDSKIMIQITCQKPLDTLEP